MLLSWCILYYAARRKQSSNQCFAYEWKQVLLEQQNVDKSTSPAQSKTISIWYAWRSNFFTTERKKRWNQQIYYRIFEICQIIESVGTPKIWIELFQIQQKTNIGEFTA